MENKIYYAHLYSPLIEGVVEWSDSAVMGLKHTLSEPIEEAVVAGVKASAKQNHDYEVRNITINGRVAFESDKGVRDVANALAGHWRDNDLLAPKIKTAEITASTVDVVTAINVGEHLSGNAAFVNSLAGNLTEALVETIGNAVGKKQFGTLHAEAVQTKDVATEKLTVSGDSTLSNTKVDSLTISDGVVLSDKAVESLISTLAPYINEKIRQALDERCGPCCPTNADCGCDTDDSEVPEPLPPIEEPLDPPPYM